MTTKDTSVSFPFTSILTLLFIGLKLTHVINWSWWWVLSPLWITGLFALLILGFVALVVSKQ